MLRLKLIIQLAIVLHISWGVQLLFDAAPAGTTPVYHLAAAFGGVENQDGHVVFHRAQLRYLGLVLIAVGSLAEAGCCGWHPKRIGWWTMPAWLQKVGPVIYIIPQQVAVILSALGCYVAVQQGHYPDGTVVTRTHIWADQEAYIFAALLHTVELLNIHTDLFQCVGKSMCRWRA